MALQALINIILFTYRPINDIFANFIVDKFIMKHLSFIVVGDEGSGKRSFVDRAALDLFNPYGHLFPGGKAKTYSYGNEEIIVFFEPKHENQQISRAEKADTFFITVDLSNANWVKRVEFHIDRVSHTHPKKPIVLLVTKADERPCDHTLFQQIVNNLREQQYNVSYIETSAKTGLNIQKAVELGVEVGFRQAEVERQSAARRHNVAQKLLKDLDQYTSFSNKVIAYGKLIFSFGQFGLAAKKQALAEQIKKETSINVGKYKQANKDLVKSEFNRSWFFSKHYTLANSKKNNDSEFDLGELGRILDRAKI
ncbi:Ras family protein [Legionella birminghamensis]|uniref:Ras family n=1 Tax=Legionella birminghamensis TaxID=28083 RepID=A0A378I8K8_9GAMM|nr:GTPase domain-containing protein [Legionella birminghamensis]KTC68229.1 Ras family protein [Legionella birminghamensis]STX31060.1 Ras family [Legionella birminghamensis]